MKLLSKKKKLLSSFKLCGHQARSRTNFKLNRGLSLSAVFVLTKPTDGGPVAVRWATWRGPSGRGQANTVTVTPRPALQGPVRAYWPNIAGPLPLPVAVKSGPTLRLSHRLRSTGSG
jgi:hypothetical protein